MKRIFSALLVMVMLFTAVGFSGVNAQTTTFNGMAVNVGDTVTYSYYLETPMKVVNTDFTISYTNSTLELVSQTKQDRFPIVNSGMMYNDKLTGQIKATCSNISSMFDFTNGGLLFKVKFVVKAAGTSTATCSIPFVNGVNPDGIAYAEVPVIKNNVVIYECVTAYEDSDIVGSCNHNFTQTRVDATCTANGSITKTCTKCGHSEVETIQATGHNFGEWVTVREATINQEGEEKRTCPHDNFTETRTIPKLTKILGDLDNDNQLTGNDVAIIQKYCAEIISLENFEYTNADLNNDNVINIKDATLIQKKIIGSI